MGYWIHVEDLPTGGGGGGGNNGGCLGCLTILGILAGISGIWYIKENIITVLSFVLVFGGLAALAGIIYILKETEFEKSIIIAGIVGFAVGAIFTNNILGIFHVASSAIGGHISMGLILAAAAMYLYSMIF